MHEPTKRHTFEELIGVYSRSGEDEVPAELVIPEDLTALSDDDLRDLHVRAVDAFNSAYGDGQGLSVDAVAELTALTEGIEALAGEVEVRSAAAVERAEAAAALAARVNPPGSGEGGDGGSGEEETGSDDETDADADEGEGDDGEADEADDKDESDDAPETVTASARKSIRVNIGALPRRSTPAPKTKTGTIRDHLLASGEGTGFVPGQGIDWADAADIFERRLQAFPEAQYAAAAGAGQHVSSRNGIVQVRKNLPDEHLVASLDPNEVMATMDRAASERNLPGGSLTAAGGWCAPSEIIYDLGCERESRDGLFSLPEIGIRRGGVQFTQGIDFSDIFNGVGFSFTEADDIAGNYGPGGTAGDKPCYRLPCPEFDEVRLAVAGLCLVGGLLQLRGYPELVSSTIRRALIAHDHKMSANVLNAVVAGSTAVTFPARVGATAPLLDSIEMQTEHYRTVHRMARSATLEAVFPFWVRGVIRSDLSRRLGVDLLSVSDAQIDGWFRARGVAAQFVYNLDPITGAATAFTAWPATARFLLYAAGTWVKGSTDIIRLDTLYDSTLLGQNDYLALFSEEGWLVAQRCPDSRIVSVPLCPDGATAAGVDIACNGTAGA